MTSIFNPLVASPNGNGLPRVYDSLSSISVRSLYMGMWSCVVKFPSQQVESLSTNKNNVAIRVVSIDLH